MAMKKQNSALLLLVVIVLVVLGYVLTKEGKLPVPGVSNETGSEVSLAQVVEQNAQELFGDRVQEASPEQVENRELQKSFALVLDDMAECLSVKTPAPASDAPVEIETVLVQLQSELGPVTQQSDRWMNWHLRNREGKERRLRMEISTNDNGEVVRSLNYYAVDRDGQPIPIDLPSGVEENPSDELISQMLKEGEVFFKDKAAYAIFPGGEKIEYIEKNGYLSEIELTKEERVFRCDDLKNRESCRCFN